MLVKGATWKFDGGSVKLRLTYLGHWWPMLSCLASGEKGHKKLAPLFSGVNPKSMAWWRHQMETFSAVLALCTGNSPITGEFPAQRPVTRSFDVFVDLRLNKWLSKQSWGWWFDTPSRPLWRHCNWDRGALTWGRDVGHCPGSAWHHFYQTGSAWTMEYG